MSGDLRLGLAQDFDEIADADFLVAHEIEQAKACVVAKSLKEAFHIEGCFCHDPIICDLTNISSENIVALTNMFLDYE